MQATKTLQKLSHEDLSVKDNSISIYGKGEVTPEVLAMGVIAIKKAFPKLGSGWYDTLEECLNEVAFTDDRFAKSIKNLILTCPYPEPAIANITSYDQRMKLFTYAQFLDETAKMSSQMRLMWQEDHPRVKLNGEPFYISKSDYNNYKQLFDE